MDSRTIALRRDSNIRADLDCHRILDIHQLYRLHFPSIYTAQRRMRTLVRKKTGINRLRLDDGRFAYYTGTKPQQIDHYIGTNDFYVWLTLGLRNGFSISHWEHPEWNGAGMVRPDAFYAIHNRWDNKTKWYCLEYETGSNPCTKVADYSRFFGSDKYKGLWWAKTVSGFPTIVIVRHGGIRAVQEDTEKNNIHGLKFQVHMAEKIRRDIGK